MPSLASRPDASPVCIVSIAGKAAAVERQAIRSCVTQWGTFTLPMRLLWLPQSRIWLLLSVAPRFPVRAPRELISPARRSAL